MAKSKKDLKKIIQAFNDDAYEDEGLQALMSELHETEVVTGVIDPLIMEKIFDYLDNKLQTEIRSHIK